jgi:hypothetical protein
MPHQAKSQRAKPLLVGIETIPTAVWTHRSLDPPQSGPTAVWTHRSLDPPQSGGYSLLGTRFNLGTDRSVV